MKSLPLGTGTSAVEVSNVTPTGFWLLIGSDELFVAFENFPWFRGASIGQLTRVELPSPDHLRWPDLDIDLAVESIRCPDKFPLVSRSKD